MNVFLMKPDSELLPLFAKMLPSVKMARSSLFWMANDEGGEYFNMPVSRTELLSLCHQIENGLTDEELVKMDEILIAGFEKNERTKTYWAFTLTLPWQSRITALARVKGLI